MQKQSSAVQSTKLIGLLAHFDCVRSQIALYRACWGMAWLVGMATVLLVMQVLILRNLVASMGSLLSLLLGVAVAIGGFRQVGARLSDIGLVPLGALGMALWAALALWVHVQGFGVYSLWVTWVGLGASLIVYLYPLLALKKQRTTKDLQPSVTRVVLSLVFMWVLFGLVIGGVVVWGVQQGVVTYVVAASGLIALHLWVVFYIFMLVPEYALRCLAWVLSHMVYRFKVQGGVNVPLSGSAIVVANHVSFVDAILLMAASPRPIRFIMDHRIFQTPVLGWVFKMAKAIPIAREAEHPDIYKAAFETAQTVLQEGDLLGIFPEGAITRDGQLQPFKGGVMKILQTAQGSGLSPPVLPMGLSHLWGSFFSRIERGGAMVRPFRRGAFNRVELHIGAPIPASQVSLPGLEQAVRELVNDEIS